MMRYFRKKDGFSGEISFVLPRDIVEASARHPLTHTLYMTDIGYYPEARHHYRERPHGADENILILCTDGQGWAWMGGHRFSLYRGNAVLLPAGLGHSYGSSDEAPWTIYWGHFAGEWSNYFLSRLKENTLILPVGSAALHRAIQTFKSIFRTLRRGYTAENVISSGLGFGEILGSILFANESYHPDLENDANRRIDATIEHMLANISASITLSDLARRAVLSVTRYSQLFRMKTGYPPIDYFTRLKIQHACHLLDATEWKIYTVSRKVGYADPYYFSRVFHKVMGVSPLQYRRRNQRRAGEKAPRADSAGAEPVLPRRGRSP